MDPLNELRFALALDKRLIITSSNKANRRMHETLIEISEFSGQIPECRFPVRRFHLLFDMNKHLEKSITAEITCPFVFGFEDLLQDPTTRYKADGTIDDSIPTCHTLKLQDQEYIDGIKFLTSRMFIDGSICLTTRDNFIVKDGTEFNNFLDCLFTSDAYYRDTFIWHRNIAAVLQGYFPPNLAKRVLSRFKSRSIILDVKLNANEHYLFTDFINPQSSMIVNKTSVHFSAKVRQKFEKIEDFVVFAGYIKANPTIGNFSFMCEYEMFNFEAFFQVLGDPDFQIPDKIIDLNFFFFSYQLESFFLGLYGDEGEYENVIRNRNEGDDGEDDERGTEIDPFDEAMEVHRELLKKVIKKRNEKRDCIRCRFQTSGQGDCNIRYSSDEL